MTTRIVALTTEDNPWSPFDEYDSWSQYDMDKGYNTEAYIDRIANLNDSIPDEMKAKLEEQAIDEIIRLNKGIIPYKKVEATVESFG